MIFGSKCCGVKELHGLSFYSQDPATFLKFHFRRDRASWEATSEDNYHIDRLFSPNFRYAYFTQAGRAQTYGEEFATYIKDQQLGEVVETTLNVNPNSGNELKMWVWTVDHDRLGEWAVRNNLFYPTWNTQHMTFQHTVDEDRCTCVVCYNRRHERRGWDDDPEDDDLPF